MNFQKNVVKIPWFHNYGKISFVRCRRIYILKIISESSQFKIVKEIVKDKYFFFLFLSICNTNMKKSKFDNQQEWLTMTLQYSSNEQTN